MQRTGNRILDALPRDEYLRIAAHARRLSLGTRVALASRSTAVKQLLFITAGLASSVSSLANGGSIANYLVGREGCVGAVAILGNDSRFPADVITEVAGTALTVGASAFRECASESSHLGSIMKRHLLAKETELTQTVACARMHDIEQRAACWLLMIADRIGNDFKMTHDQCAQMLGSRRATVTTQAEALQRSGVISYNYGRLHIVSRSRLERLACECYGVYKSQFDNFL